MKCDNCVHKGHCRFEPNESYPQYMKDVMSESCKNFEERKSDKI